MKHRFLIPILSVLLLTTNCSGSDQDDKNTLQSNQVNNQYFNPPAWIQGTWGTDNGFQTTKHYKFTTNDFYVINGQNETSLTTSINAHPYGGSVTETTTDIQYNFTINYNNAPTTQKFEFKKVSSTKIQWKDINSNMWYDLIKM